MSLTTNSVAANGCRCAGRELGAAFGFNGEHAVKRVGIGCVLAWLCSACADDASFDATCAAYATTAVVVEVVGDQPVTAVTATHGDKTARCYPSTLQDSAMGETFSCFEVGWGSDEKYTINVHGSDERWTKSVDVKSDQCHVTEVKTLSIDLASDPSGSAELADCQDGSGRGPGDCCRELPPEGSCSAEGIECRSHCSFATPEAKTGTQSFWTCRDGQWAEGAKQSRCIREGVRKDDPDLREPAP